jgi:hypothetical protein
MKISSLIYRVRQFWLAVQSTAPTAKQLAPAQQILTASQMNLFTQMQASEQNHSLRVLQTIQNQGESNPDLHVAALLHDVGKTRYPLHLWERVFVVVGKKLFAQIAKKWGQGEPRGWKRPFVVAEQHPLWGWELALEAGTTPLAAKLIRRHQEKNANPTTNQLEEHLLSILQNADNLH